MLQTFVNYGLEHWGSDTFGVNLTRRFLCEFMSFFTRYIPSGIIADNVLRHQPIKWNGRDEMEQLLASRKAKDWVTISERFLGKAPETFTFVPKHKSSEAEEDNG